MRLTFLLALTLCALVVWGMWILGTADDPSVDPAAYERGKAVFLTRCFQCHGEQADGQGPLSAQLVGQKPADFRHPRFAALPSDSIKHVITEGGEAAGKNPMMPAWGAVLAPEDIDDLVVFIQAVSRSGTVLPTPNEGIQP